MKLKGLRKLACMAMVTTFLVTSAAQLGTVYATETAQTAIVEVAEETGASPVVAAESDPAGDEEETPADSLTVAAKKSYTYAFDINSASNAKATVELEGLVTVVNNSETKTYDDTNKDKWLFSTDKTTYTPASGISVKAIKTADDKKTVTITAEIEKSVIAKANTTKILYLAYNKGETKELINVPFTIKRTPDTFGTAADATNETKVVTASNVTSFSYTGANPYLVVNSKYGTKKVNAIELINNSAIESVVVMDGVTTLKAGAITSANNTNLKTVILPDSITTVEPGAIVVGNKNVICSDKVKNLITAAGSNTAAYVTSTSKAAKYASGSEVEVDLKTMKIGGTSGKDLMAIGDSVDNIKAIAEDKTAVEDVKWMVCKPGTLTASSSATIKDAKNTATGSASITLTNLKSKGDFNEKVDIVALSKSTGRVYARGTLYITPEEATEWKTEPTATKEIEEGKSWKIDGVLKNGKDKTLVYEIGIPSGNPAGLSADCISITNGTIKGIKPGIATVKVKPLRGTAAEKTIEVTVKAKKAKATKASVSAITLKKGSTEAQEFTVFADTLTTALGDVTVELANKSTNLDIKYQDGQGNWQSLPEGGKIPFGSKNIGVITVASKDGKAVNDTIKLTSKLGDAELKTAQIKVSTKDALVNPAKFSQPSSKKPIDIPVGTTRKLGLSLPATGKSGYKVFVKGGADNNGNGLTAIGDVLMAETAGTYTVSAVSVMTRNAMVYIPNSIFGSGYDKYVELPIPCAVSDEFTVNVYDPASTFVFPAKAVKGDSIVQGGYLIKQAEADWDCNKSFKTGTSAVLDYPNLGSGTEDIIWTVSKPGAVTIAKTKSGDKYTLKLNFNAAGKFTVTGTTKYSKMKTKFTVQVDAPTLDEWNAAKKVADTNIQVVKVDAKDATVNTALAYKNSKFEVDKLSKGDSFTLALFLKDAANAGGNVTFTTKSEDLTVSKTGLVKLKNDCTNAEITATLVPAVKNPGEAKAEFTIVVNPSSGS